MTLGEADSRNRLTHVDEHGKAHMVDVTGKEMTLRVAEARCLVRTTADVVRLATDPSTGMDLMESARVAGIMPSGSTPSRSMSRWEARACISGRWRPSSIAPVWRSRPSLPARSLPWW
jgi:hypothetical protein